MLWCGHVSAQKALAFYGIYNSCHLTSIIPDSEGEQLCTAILDALYEPTSIPTTI